MGERAWLHSYYDYTCKYTAFRIYTCTRVTGPNDHDCNSTVFCLIFFFQVARLLGKSVMAEDKMNDSAAQDEQPTDNDQPDNMEVSGAEVVSEKERQVKKKEQMERETENGAPSSQDSSQFETAPTHHRIYPSLPPMDTQLSFLTPSAQPSAPPQLLDNTNRKSPEQNEPISGRDSPRITTLLALRSTRTGAKKTTGSSSSMAASSSSARPASSTLESLQPAKKQGDNTLGKKKLPTEAMSPTKSGSSSKRKPSMKSVRHAVPVITNQPSPPSSSVNGTKPTRNGTKTSSPESDFETAREGIGAVEGSSGDREQASSSKEGGENGGKKSEVIIRTNTYTHLGTKRKSTGAFGSTSSTDSSSSESWQTAQASEGGGNNGSSLSSSPPPVEPSPTKRLRSLVTPSVPSLRRALGGSKVTTQQPQNSSSVVKNSRGNPSRSPAKNGSSPSGRNQAGHSRSLSIGSGLAAILSRPLVKSPTASALQKHQDDPVVKKEPSHSWISQFFHKS